ncbi:MAG TPA: alanyl-tRNA editing protein [Aestuariivirga sp.]|jgi:misacylated tRNA(Ala) deacylase|nr:alanyl-tRNA editing protein [Hyphomicrobiales bacterium]MBP9173334.1 alanyl-tRNA editing protein [Hyphomicrobiales bacterium]HQY72289.1 alanyl-tRNA editing protein [Aestuariivirga sp.]
MTELIFREDAYLKSVDAIVQGINERGGIVLDKTNFYAAAGGQPGDRGTITVNGKAIDIATTIYDEMKNIVHVPASAGDLPEPGAPVTLALDWHTRYRNMRAHTMMHLLCACVPFPVTGGSISEDGGRIDFDIPEGQIPDKEDLAARINRLIVEDHKVSFRWISDAEMEANLHLVRTMSVKPPMGTGKVRLVMIGEEGKIDLQPCGGTHVKSTAEIGPIRVAKIENKGKINRRIRLAFA